MLITAGWAFYAALVLFFAFFTVSCFLERERRAAGRSLAVLSFLGAGAAFFFVLPGAGNVFFLGLAVGGVVGFFVFLLTGRPRTGQKISGQRKRVDERDVVFARFDLRPGERMKDYYRNHPEFDEIDERIREKPDLFSPEHMKKAPWAMALGAAEFDFLENQLTFVSGPVSEKKSTCDPEDASKRIKSVLRYLGAADSGICRLDEADLYSHVGRGPEPYGEPVFSTHSFAVAFTVEMDYDMIRRAPRAPVIVETAKKYVEAAKISIILASFIRRLGFDARAHIAGSNYQAMCVPVAWKAGLGEVGRMGILMTPRFGPRVRLGLVTTEMPLTVNEPVVFGVQDFCSRCLKCADNCPSGAISRGGPEENNGTIRWLIDREKCYGYWRKAGTDCARCIFVCPYSKPDNLFHGLIRAAARSSHAVQILSVRGDDFFYGRKPGGLKSDLLD
ncbi:MAG: 4Fe-4S dicluster domain-containing protein [Acidobacteria bacterium]|nr:4Fe-4S dicluster domain-containing protein [Acidobacteriota bacterium]MBU1473562.1 4Fe-4S dicluster domain-containing protein [Acidobacteriota bacterium]